MLLSRISHPAALLLAVAAAVFAASPARADEPVSKLGRIEFPTSGSEHAQRHFLRGVAAMHSFWYEEALEAVRESTKADPDFAMGYWGEAMAHNHPIWKEQDTEAARAALRKIPDTAKMTPRERAYVNAARILYGEGDKQARDKAYAAAMEKVYRDYPDDLEAACFYALSLLGLGRQSDTGLRRHIQAGAITLEVFRKNPDHPCAAHYAIHAFDDPEHAVLALPAARRYAQIAPEAHHAQHMPAHIFLQLGMWPEAAASNEAGWAASVSWVKKQGLHPGLRDYHSLYWLFYVFLQQGRYDKAEELLALKRKDMVEAGDEPKAMPFGHKGDVGRYYEEMVATYAVETERWEWVAKYFEKPGAKEAGKTLALLIYTRGLAAAQEGRPEADAAIAELRALRRQGTDTDQTRRSKPSEIREWQIAAVAKAAKSAPAEALDLMKRAVEQEEQSPPPSGPPDTIKPSHELYGELLLRAGRPKEAAQQFATSLVRHPNRARSLLGAARAAAQSGDQHGAMSAYAKLLEVWAQADQDLPDLREARDSLQQVGTKGR